MKYESPQTPICSGTESIIDTSKIFRVGDIVKTVPHPLFGAKSYTGKIDIIVNIDDRVDAMYPYKLKKLNMWIHPNELEHYIEEKEEVMEEKEVDKKDNFTTKELNLCELLKGYEGKEFYSLMHGQVRFMTISADEFVMFDIPESISVYDNGKYDLNAEVIIYPSRALYEKYPLDAYSAWMEWKSERTPKRWRAEKNDGYYIISTFGETNWFQETNSELDEMRYTFGNYFEDESLCQQAAEAVRECLAKFHEQNNLKQ